MFEVFNWRTGETILSLTRPDWAEALSLALGPDYDWDDMRLCHHGMRLTLCADPISHYPRGYPYD